MAWLVRTRDENDDGGVVDDFLDADEAKKVIQKDRTMRKNQKSLWKKRP